MGVWGTGIFSDDVASDVRDRYRSLVGQGATGVEATDFLLGQFGNLVYADPDTRSAFWLGLAVTQWKCGRLEDRVKLAALDVIDGGVDEASWQDDAKLWKARKKVLQETRALLVSPQPPAKRIRKKYVATCDWEIGELIAFRLRSGKYIVFRVVQHYSDDGGTFPVVEFLDWVGDSPIVGEDLLERPHRAPDQYCSNCTLLNGSSREVPQSRLVRLGLQDDRPEARGGLSAAVLWRSLDQSLEQRFGWS